MPEKQNLPGFTRYILLISILYDIGLHFYITPVVLLFIPLALYHTGENHRGGARISESWEGGGGRVQSIDLKLLLPLQMFYQ